MPDYYEVNAKEYFAQTFQTNMTEAYGHFLPKLACGSRILDLGSGSGRDAVYFSRHGYEVTALEPSHSLCEEIHRHFYGEIVCSSIENYQPARRFDAVWACASLLHLTKEELLRFFTELDKYLKPGGLLYASGKNGIQTGRCGDGRYFLEFSEALLQEILEAAAYLEIDEIWYSKDVSGRSEFRWMNFVLKYQE